MTPSPRPPPTQDLALRRPQLRNRLRNAVTYQQKASILDARFDIVGVEVDRRSKLLPGAIPFVDGLIDHSERDVRLRQRRIELRANLRTRLRRRTPHFPA